MIRPAFVAAVLLASQPAFAGDVYSFRIGGQSIRIEQPRDCNDAACMSISIPGIYEQNGKRKKARDVEVDKPMASVTPAPAPAPTAAPQQTAAITPPEKSLEPANGATSTSSNALPGPQTTRSEPPSNGLAPPKVAALAPAPVASPPVVVAAASPVGVWMTEEKEGKVRIEACGPNLCGYALDARTQANGDPVLINMKPGKDKWAGKIQDPNTGSTYDSTIAMRSDNRLRVQGCAFGGMFCGGQTWTRAN